MALTLDIAIATHRKEGIMRLAASALPRIEDVSYVISWQNHKENPIPEELIRPDIHIFRFDLTGQSRNRNNALRHCSSDIVLISDDDVTYEKAGIKEMMKTFESNDNSFDIATFRSIHGDIGRFPCESVNLNDNWPKGYHVSGIEIALRRNRCTGLKFCPEFGLASPKLHGAEDEMFVLSAIKRGLRCRYFPVTICSHPHESTGTKSRLSIPNMRAAGCYIALRWPISSLVRLPLKAWRIFRNGKSSLPRALWAVASGAMMAPGVLHRNHDSLW